jgi:hypothetical protein
LRAEGFREGGAKAHQYIFIAMNILATKMCGEIVEKELVYTNFLALSKVTPL